MTTALFDNIIFGPVHSRRLGISLGVNLLPTDVKLCNFNCIYCECGWNRVGERARFNRREDVRRLLEERLRKMSAADGCPDVITFAGNGEPTMHPDFEQIIDDAISLRDAICPSSKISVLSNAAMIGRENVRRALLKVDNNILKLDSAFDETVRLVNDPQGRYSVKDTVGNMMKFGGRLIIQTMFLRGTYRGQVIDNTAEREVSAWLELVKKINPQMVMIYTIDRGTPAEDLHKIPLAELRAIAERVEALGIPATVSG